MKHFWRTGLFALVAMGCYAGVAAAQDGGDPAAGRIKAGTCMGCHGIPNYSNAYPAYHVPKLGGQRAEYLVAALRAYESGKREHPTMEGQASSLGERDIRDIAAFLARAPGVTGADETEGGATAKADSAWLERTTQTCAGCHGPKGATPIADYPIIAGQYESYLVHALKAYRDGTRANPVMRGQAAALGDAQIEALADYYSSLESPLHVPAVNR